MVNARAMEMNSSMYCSKAQLKTILGAEKKYKKAIWHSMQTVMPAVVIAVWENSQVRETGLIKWKKALYDVIEECAADDDLTIFQVLEEKTGLEIQIGDGVSYKDTAFANAKIFDQHMNDLNPMKWIRYYQKKAQWANVIVMSACMMGLHNAFRWSAEGNLSKILLKANEILDWYGTNPKAFRLEYERVTGLKLDDLFKDIPK